MPRQSLELRVVSDEYPGQKPGQRYRQPGETHPRYQVEQDALPKHILQLVRVAGAVVVADDRRRAYRVAYEDRDEDEVYVHDGAVRRDAVLSLEMEELLVVEHIDDRRRDTAHQLGRAVRHRVKKDVPVDSRPCQLKTARVEPPLRHEKIDERYHAAHTLTETGRHSRARDAPPEHRDEKIVEHHIRASRRDRHRQPHLGLLRRHEEALEHVLEHESGQRDEIPPSV